jgi:hypothetical protein
MIKDGIELPWNPAVTLVATRLAALAGDGVLQVRSKWRAGVQAIPRAAAPDA